jgi:DNA mismatch endonuclease (patch repair protein)
MTRSENMSRIRSRNTGPEIELRQALWAAGCRYRLKSNLPGQPDLVFSKARLAVFMDGCFWHGCPLHYSAPRTRQDYWKSKLRRNVLRDISVNNMLVSDSWRVLRIWQHELKDMKAIVHRILSLIHPTDESWQTDIPAVMGVSESVALYGPAPSRGIASECWWQCRGCGSQDVAILEAGGHGSLRPNSSHRPDYVELICRKCGEKWIVDIGGISRPHSGDSVRLKSQAIFVFD